MKCKNCGFDSKEGVAFCSNCGTRFEQTSNDALGSHAQPEQNIPQPHEHPAQPYNQPYNQPMQPYGQPMPPYDQPPPAERKKSSNVPIIIAAICAVLVVTVGTILILTLGINSASTDVGEVTTAVDEIYPIRTPLPAIPTDPIDASELDGVWGFLHGDIVFFFGLSDFVMFVYHDDDGGEVYESQWSEWGEWHIADDGRLIVEGEWTGTHVFYIILENDTLTIIDIDGDAITYTRVE